MTYTSANPNILQSLLFHSSDFNSCFFRYPSERELEFQSFLHTIVSLLTPREVSLLSVRCSKGRNGYHLTAILGIMLLKLFYRQATMKETLLLLQENGNLKDIVGIAKVPSEATVSRLARKVETLVKPEVLHERIITFYHEETGRMVGHLSIDSTIIEAREKPYRKDKAPKTAPRKRGRKKKGSPEEKAYVVAQAAKKKKKEEYLRESPEISLARLEKRCSLTAKQNSKGKNQWFIGYKAHISTDDFGIPISYAVTGACVHDCKVAVPLMKIAHQYTDFYYVLMDKGYINPDIDAYANLIERKVIIDQRRYGGVDPPPMCPATACRYQARTTVERTNSELKDGFLPSKIYRKGRHARYDIALSILLTTLKKVRNVLTMREEIKARKAS